MDGTMLDTEPIYLDGWRAAISEQGIAMSGELFDDIFTKVIGLNVENCRKIITENIINFDFDRGFEVNTAYRDNYISTYGVPIKPGLFELLGKLEWLNSKKAVATSSRSARAIPKLTIANLAHCFDAIVCGDEVENGKPAPDIFLRAAALCGVAPENCLVLEDSAAGVKAGLNAGMPVILIPDILPPDEETSRMASQVCKNLYEVAKIL